MCTMKELANVYLSYCEKQKRLSSKTIRAYRSDLSQMIDIGDIRDIGDINCPKIENLLELLNNEYCPSSVRRKLASLRAFLRYLEYKNILSFNPFHKLNVHVKIPEALPRTLPIKSVEAVLYASHMAISDATTEFKRINALRDCAFLETLFSTGMRVSELCWLESSSVDLIIRGYSFLLCNFFQKGLARNVDLNI